MVLDDNALIDGKPMKRMIVEAHQPDNKAPKFNSVEMCEFTFWDHGNAVVVTCKGEYQGPQWSGTIRFMRVWVRKNGATAPLGTYHVEVQSGKRVLVKEINISGADVAEQNNSRTVV
ncbi:MAG TPA: hypothetical protein VMV05_12590 [bacterium]|nr:hypothetical protein [bacterium]